MSNPEYSSNEPMVIKLTKVVSSNRNYSQGGISAIDFDDLAKTKKNVNDYQIGNFYRNVFYDIPINGTNSHEEIVRTSDDWINQRSYKSYRSRNKRLIEDISVKEGKLLTLKNPSIKENPSFEDGSFIMVGDGNGNPDQDMGSVYIMQEGLRREFKNDAIYMKVRRAFGLPEDHTGVYFATVSELNLQTTKGADISQFSDLNLKGDALIVDGTDILGVSAYTELELTCEGNEISDYITSWMGSFDEYHNNETSVVHDIDGPEGPTIYTYGTFNESAESNVNDLEQIQFYLDNQACEVQYIIDDFYNDELGPTVEKLVIPAGSTHTIKVLRDSGGTNNNMPLNMNQYYDEHPINTITYNGNDISNYIHEWGPIGKYNSVVYAEGRILYREVYNGHLHGSPPDGLGIPYNDTQLVFNGLPTGDTGTWEVNPDIGLIDYDGYTGQEESMWGTKMLYKSYGLFGNLGQEDGLQESFDDPHNWYYRPQILVDDQYFPVYGQPIIRYNQKYYVLLYVYKAWNGGNRVKMYDIEGDDVDRYSKSELEKTGLTASYEGGTVNWLELDVDVRLKFPGLRGWRPNGYTINDNPFNTIEEGSNYFKTYDGYQHLN